MSNAKRQTTVLIDEGKILHKKNPDHYNPDFSTNSKQKY